MSEETPSPTPKNFLEHSGIWATTCLGALPDGCELRIPDLPLNNSSALVYVPSPCGDQFPQMGSGDGCCFCEH